MVETDPDIVIAQLEKELADKRAELARIAKTRKIDQLGRDIDAVSMEIRSDGNRSGLDRSTKANVVKKEQVSQRQNRCTITNCGRTNVEKLRRFAEASRRTISQFEVGGRQRWTHFR